MALRQLFDQFNSLSLAMKIGIVVAIVGALFLVGNTRTWISHFKDRSADKAVAAERANSEVHRKRADESEAKAREDEARRRDTEAKLALTEMAVQAAGAKAEAIAEKVKVEDAKLTEELQRVGDSIEPCERVRRVCTRLRIPPQDCSCTSN